MEFNNEMNFETEENLFDTDMSFDIDINNEPIASLYPEFGIETKFKNELDGFIKRDFLQRDRIEKQTDAGYYCVLTFQSETQRNIFLDALNIKHLLWDYYFINGLKASEILGIEQEKIELSKAKFRKGFTNDII